MCERDDRESLSNTVKERITKQLSREEKKKKKQRMKIYLVRCELRIQHSLKGNK